jgi:ParB family transcriptional regulator, chromosome partitioning protein
MTKRQALGRGLSALIAPTATDSPGGPRQRLERVPLEQVVPSPDQPRKHFDQERIAELVTSLREKGVIQPLIVRRIGDTYEIIAGERRWRAAREAGFSSVPVVVREASSREAYELAIIENIQREDLNPIEEASAYQRLIDEASLTQDQLAQRLGRDRSTIANSLRLLKLPPPVQTMLVAGELAEGHGRALLGLRNPAGVIAMARKAAQQGWSVREVERRVRRARTMRERTAGKRVEDAASSDLIRRIEQRLGTKVILRGDENSGSIQIRYFSRADLDRLSGLLLGEGS